MKRFWAKVNKDGPIMRPELGPCWLWTGYIDADGYGRIQVEGKSVRAHRLSWQLNIGPIPSGLSPLHRCDNPPCIRLSHLFLGTHLDNMRDRASKGRYVLPSGGEHWNSKLTVEQVSEIRRLYVPWRVTVRILAAKFQVSKSAIGDVLTERNWRRG